MRDLNVRLELTIPQLQLNILFTTRADGPLNPSITLVIKTASSASSQYPSPASSTCTKALSRLTLMEFLSTPYVFTYYKTHIHKFLPDSWTSPKLDNHPNSRAPSATTPVIPLLYKPPAPLHQSPV